MAIATKYGILQHISCVVLGGKYSSEEERCNALVQSARYLQGVRRYHDRNVQERSFNIGDMVLRRI